MRQQPAVNLDVDMRYIGHEESNVTTRSATMINLCPESFKCNLLLLLLLHKLISLSVMQVIRCYSLFVHISMPPEL